MWYFPIEYLNWVVSISNKIWENSFVIWTWFLFAKKHKITDTHSIYLITNRHVIENSSENLIIKMTNKKWLFEEYSLNKSDPAGSPLFYNHPDNSIDIAVTSLSWEGIPKKSKIAFFYTSDTHSLLLESMVVKGVQEWDNIFVFWFPSSITQGRNDYPIVRSGTIAQIQNFYNKWTPNYLIDSFTFPWNSGWPIIVNNNWEGKLIWILAWYLEYNDFLRSDQTKKVVHINTLNSWITVVFSVDQILETIDAYERI